MEVPIIIGNVKPTGLFLFIFFFTLAFGLLAVGHAGEHCLLFQWADGWLREERNCQLYLNSVGNREKEEAHTQMDKLMIYPRTVIYNKIYEFFFSNYFSP